MLSKKIIIPVAAIAVGGAAIFGTGMVFAQTSSNNGPFSGLAQAIAQKFNLDQTQVQTVVDQFASTKKSNMQQKMLDMEDKRLTNLVTQGKITAAQKTAIEAELATLKSKYMDNQQNLTADQRKQNMQNYQNDLKTWATTQGIDLTILRPTFGPGMKGGRHWGKGMNPSPTPSATPQS